MSYPKYHSIYKAVEPFINKGAERHLVYLFAFIVYLAKKNNLSLDLSLDEILENTDLKVLLKEYLKNEIQILKYRSLDKALNAFKNVSLEEITEFLCDREFLLLDKDKNFYSNLQPSGVNDLACRLFDFNTEDTLLDLGSGLTFFLNYVSKNYELKSLVGKEKNSLMYLYGNILLEICESNIKIFQEDIFENEIEQKYTKVFSTPPFGDFIDIERNKNQIEYVFSKIGCITKDSVIGFILKAIDLIQENGKAIICAPLITLFGDKEYKALRKYCIDNKYLESIIELPNGVFYPYAGIKTCLLVLSKKRNDKVLFLNATSLCSKTRRGGSCLLKEDVNNIFDVYTNENTDISLLKKVISTEEIIENNYDWVSNGYLFEAKIELKKVDKYVELGKLLKTKIIRGAQYKAEELDKKDTNLPTDCFYLSVKNIQNGKINSDLTKLDYIDDKYGKLILQDNDLLLGMILSDSINLALIQNIKAKKIIPANNIYIIRPNQDLIYPLFLKMLLESEKAKILFKTFSSSSSLSAIGIDFLNNLLIPLPNMEIQKELAKKYNSIEVEQEALMKRWEQISLEKKEILSLFEEEEI